MPYSLRMHLQTYKSLREARDFMRHAYGRQVSLPDVAARANLSPFHFLRVYKRAYGETPHEFLAELTPGPMFDAETAEGIRSLVERGAFGIGVFETDDIQGDYERLSGQGVGFLSPPKEQFYGTEAIVKDNSGIWFSLTERKR